VPLGAGEGCEGDALLRCWLWVRVPPGRERLASGGRPAPWQAGWTAAAPSVELFNAKPESAML